MNLVLDIGNTRTKLAVFDVSQLIFSTAISKIQVTYLDELSTQFTFQNAIISATGEFPNEVKQWLQSHFRNLFILSSEITLPFEIRYDTKQTLGKDRIAGIAGAQVLFPQHNCLVVDAGTAITYDFIDSQGIYWGGNISPGISMRFQALHTFTQNLPLIQQIGDMPLMGYSTETAIRSGVLRGVIYETERFIQELSHKYSKLYVILTGGDAVFLADKINYPIFVDEFLVLKGLNRILEYNVHK